MASSFQAHLQPVCANIELLAMRLDRHGKELNLVGFS